jgi:hypothetical protein
VSKRPGRKLPGSSTSEFASWRDGAGIICTGESYTKAVKLTFAKGASVPDPSGVFNSSMEGKTRRAIDIHEGAKIDARAFKTLVRAAVAQNGATAR